MQSRFVFRLRFDLWIFEHAKSTQSFTINQASSSTTKGGGGEREGRILKREEGREFSPPSPSPLAIELLIPVASPSRVHVSMFVATLTRRAYLPCRSPVICSPSWPDEEALAAAAATTPSPLQRNYVMLAKLFE